MYSQKPSTGFFRYTHSFCMACLLLLSTQIKLRTVKAWGLGNPYIFLQQKEKEEKGDLKCPPYTPQEFCPSSCCCSRPCVSGSWKCLHRLSPRKGINIKHSSLLMGPASLAKMTTPQGLWLPIRLESSCSTRKQLNHTLLTKGRKRESTNYQKVVLCFKTGQPERELPPQERLQDHTGKGDSTQNE